MAPSVKAIDPFGMPQAYFAGATITEAPQTIHISGQVGTSKSGTTPADYESQIHLALLNLKRVLTASGAKVTDIAKLTLYIVNYDAGNRLHTRHIQKLLGTHKPAITLVPVPKLAMPEWLFEIDAVVAKQSENTAAPSPPQKMSPPERIYDVVVVGAGLSGLTAARNIIQNGLQCLVLEARDRVGGKTWSQNPSGKGVVDLGAAWINDTNQSRMIALANELGSELIEQNTTGDCVFQDHDGSCSTFAYGQLPDFDVSIQQNVAYIRDLCEAECQKVDSFNPKDSSLDSLTFEAFLRQSGATDTAKTTATIWTRAMLGQEPRDISALYFLTYCKAGGGLLQMRSDRKGGGQHLRLRKGTQSFSEGLVSKLPPKTVRLSSPVLSIIQSADVPVRITTTTGTIQSRKVILSVPGPCLQSITFHPKLPEQLSLLTSSLTYGYYTKVMITFLTPFWTPTHCGLAQSFCGPASVIRDTSTPPSSHGVLTCFMGGDPGRKWSILPPQERINALLEQISSLFAKGDLAFVKGQYERYDLHEWSQEEYSGWGCPCTALPPGVLDCCGEVLGRPVGDLHFIGTETAGVWKGYMEGAVRSGERGAAEVIEKLKVESAKL